MIIFAVFKWWVVVVLRSQGTSPSPCSSPQRKSTGSITSHKPPGSDDRANQSGVQKVSFLPSVVTPNLSTGLTSISPRKQIPLGLPAGHHRTVQGRTSRLGQGPPQSGRLPQPPSSLSLVVSPQLAVVSEGSESSSSDKTITPSSLFGRELATPKSSDSPASDVQIEEREDTLTATRNMFSTGSFQPDSLESSVNRVQKVAKPAVQPSNLVVHYALNNNNNSRSLSPIWNQMQLMRSESESTSSSYG